VSGTQEAGRSAVYAYDQLSRLTAAVTSGSTTYAKWGLAWSYDRYGNRLAQNITAGTAYSNALSFSASNGALTNRPDGYSFDAAGNMLGDGINTSLTYDQENRLTSINGGAATYMYEGNRHRIKRVSGGTTTVYIFAGSQVIAEYDNGAAPGSPSREYIYGDRGKVALISGTSVSYYHSDHLSVRLTTNSSGSVGVQQGHYPFGELWYQTGGSTPFIFTGHNRDSESGNDYAMARYYGIFTIADVADKLQGSEQRRAPRQANHSVLRNAQRQAECHDLREFGCSRQILEKIERNEYLIPD
jgi:hypothetical protein